MIKRFTKNSVEMVVIVFLALTGTSFGLDQPDLVPFDTQDPGVDKSIPIWGLDTAWLSDVNVRRGAIFMGKPQVDVIRFSFTGDTPIVGGNLSGSGITEFGQRMNIVDAYTDAHTKLYLNNDTADWNTNPYLVAPNQNGVDAAKWAELIDVTRRECEAAGREVLAVSPFNEPDHGVWQGDVSRLNQVNAILRGTYGANFSGIRLIGGSTLNNDFATGWYNTLNNGSGLEEGCTHQLAGSFSSYASFFQTVEANGDLGLNDELHNTMEAMVGAEYGMDGAIWWGPAERTRGEFVQASDGDRLGYAENRPNWTAASVYRAPSGAVKAFVGQSERQSNTGEYRFLCKDRPVFFDGHGPQHAYSVATTGNGIYGTDEGAIQPNSEAVINITWGNDVQPPIDGRYFLVNRKSKLYMSVASGSMLDGANIWQAAYNGGNQQKWDMNPMPADSGGDYAHFSLVAAHSGKAADLDNFSFSNGANIQQWGFITYPNVNQQWYLEYVEDGWFRICNKYSGQYLEPQGGSTQPLASIVQNSLNTSDPTRQQWRLVRSDAGQPDFVAPGQVAGLSATANPASVQLNWTASAAGDLDGYTVLRSDDGGTSYNIIARGLTATAYTDCTANQPGTYDYKIQAVDQWLNRSIDSTVESATVTGGPALVAHYEFEGNADDSSVNGNNGVTNGGVTYTDGGLGAKSLSLDGGDSYLDLPAQVVNYDEVTIAGWVYWNGGEIWQRIFDFGSGETEYLFLTPNSGAGMRFAIKNGGAEQTLTAPILTVGQWKHVAVTLSATAATLYVDGVSVDTDNTFTIKPSDFRPVQNYIGRSQWSDPLFNGAIDDFRIYNYALDATAVAALAAASPALPTQTSVSFQSAQPMLGSDDVAYLSSSVNDGTNVGSGADTATYIRYNFNNLGQTFTTGSDPGGYVMDGFWLRHVSYQSWFKMDTPGITLQMRVLQPSGTSLSLLHSEDYTWTASEPGIGLMPATGNNVGTGVWMHFEFATPVALDPDTQYAFDVGTTDASVQFYVETAGTSTNGYTGGAAYSTASKGALNMGTVHAGDHTFVVELASTAVAPDMPTGLAAVSADAQVSLSWDPAANATGYSVRAAFAEGGPYAEVGTPSGESFVDSSLTNGVTYYYVIAAVGSGGESAETDPVSAVPSPAVAPEEFYIANHAVEAGNILMTVSNSVMGHDYEMLAADALTTNTAWSNVVIQAGTGSNLLFGIPIDSLPTNRFFMLDVQRQ